MQTLPREMLLHINDYLDDSTLKALSTVCRFFNTLTQTERLKRRLEHLSKNTAAKLLSVLFETKLADGEIEWYTNPNFEKPELQREDVLFSYIIPLLNKYKKQFDILAQKLEVKKIECGYEYLTKIVFTIMKEKRIGINKPGYLEFTIGHLIFLTKSPAAVSLALKEGVDITAENDVGETMFAAFTDYLGCSYPDFRVPHPELIEICLLHCKKHNLTIPFDHGESTDPITINFYNDESFFKHLNQHIDSSKVDMLIRTIAIFHTYFENISSNQEELTLLSHLEEISKQNNKDELFVTAKKEFSQKLFDLAHPNACFERPMKSICL